MPNPETVTPVPEEDFDIEKLLGLDLTEEDDYDPNRPVILMGEIIGREDDWP